MSNPPAPTRFYAYDPSKTLPIVFSILVGLSLLLHIYQNFRHRAWRVTFWMFYGGSIYTTGWICRAIFSRDPANKDLFMAQYILILCGPPIFSAAEYNVLARIMHYVPQHAVIGPNRVLFFFTYLSALIESLTAAGGAMMAGATTVEKWDRVKTGGTLVAIAVVLQAVAQVGFACTVAAVHIRVSKANMLTKGLRTVFIMLYGTSTLVVIRCVYRAIEKFTLREIYITMECNDLCAQLIRKEWYLFAFDAAPMVLYTLWINAIHPARFLPHDKNVFLDYEKLERIGPKYERPKMRNIRWMSLLDMGLSNAGDKPKDNYWERPQEWAPVDGNVSGRRSGGVQEKRVGSEESA